MTDITICLLFYGDHFPLAARLLNSLRRHEWQEQFNLRIGTNQACPETLSFVQAFCDWRKQFSTKTWTFNSPENIYKYPLMRDMFHAVPLETKYTMWFDDDSWIKDSAPGDWFDLVRRKLTDHDMVGHIWTWKLLGNQHQFIEDQAWYAGKAVQPAFKVPFATGGWWTIDTEIIQKYQWPIPQLCHRGGDVMLGELLRQQGYKLGNFKDHLAINADEQGRNSKAPRRGYNEKPLGEEYQRHANDS